MPIVTDEQAVMPLSAARPGHVLRVCGVHAGQDDGIRLKRMGICVDRPLELVQAGDPMILLVVGARIGISRQLAELVLVKPESSVVGDDNLALDRRTA